MHRRRHFNLGLLAALGTACAGRAQAQGPVLPAHYPAAYRTLVQAGQREGAVVLYAAADLSSVAPLLRDFEALYPGIRVEYRELNSADLNNRFLAEAQAGRPHADVLWSPAMDLQVKLANDAQASPYHSPETAYLPEWAVWRDTAWGTTLEPAVIVYNKRALAPEEVPRDHAAFMALLRDRRERFLGRVVTYDIARSAIGFLFATQDARVLHGYWDLVGLLGQAGVQFEPETSAMMERIASGKALLGYNLIGSYAMARARHDPAIGVVLPADYTLVMSRIAILNRQAPHPNAARLWLDHLLSARGQALLAQRAGMASLRSDAAGEAHSVRLREQLGASLRAINVGPGLLVYRDQTKQAEFLRRWRREAQAPS